MNLFAIAGLSTSIFCFMLAMIALIYSTTKLHRLLMLFNLILVIWGLGTFLAGRATSASSALSAWKFANAGGIFISITFYHMVCVFAELQRKKSIIFAYLQGFVFLYLTSFTNLVVHRTRFIFDSIYYNDATWIFYFIILIWLVIVCSSFYELFKYLKKVEGDKRQQTLYLFFGAIIGFIGGSSTLLPMFGIDLYPLGNLTISIYCLIITYTILRHRLMDIKVDVSHFSIITMFLTFIFGIPLGLLFMNPFTAAGLLLGITCLSLVLIVLVHGKTKLHRVWALFNLVISLWGFGAFLVGKSTTPSSAIINWKLAHIGGIFIPVCFFHTICIFSNIEVKRRNFIIFAYLQGLFFLFLNSTDLFITQVRFVFNSLYYNQSTGLFYPLFFFIWISLVMWGFYELVMYYKESSGIKKNQSLYLLVGMLVGFSGGGTNFFPMFGIDIYPFGNFTIPIYCLISTYAIFRYRLMDISLVFKRTAAYSLSAGLITAFFAILVLTITNLLSTIAHVSSFTISIFAVVIIALLFNPLRNRIQKIIDKTFYKKTYDYIETVNKVSHDLASILDLKKIFNSVGDIIFSTMGLKSIYLLAISPSEDYEVVYSMEYGGGKKGRQQTTEHRVQTTDDRPQDGTKSDEKIRLYTPFQKEDSPDFHPLAKVMTRRGGEGEFEREIQMKISHGSDLVRLLKTSNDVVIKDELPGIVEVIKQETIDNISSAMKPFNGEVVAPVFIDDKLSLLIVLGGKLSGDIFTNEDVNLLRTVSNQTAIAIKNASLYAEKLRSERFASIGMMSATFAHEIRNPLTSIKTFAQLFPEKYMDTDFREVFSKVVVDDIERIDGLIRDLMDFSSIGKALSYIDDVDVVSLIDEILSYLEGKLGLENKKISVEKIYKDVKINILGDSEKLKQAFINIITNGCQAMGENGVLKVNITPKGREVDIAISDTGKGISQEEISRLFDPFYTTKPMGMGLGLAISKKIIEDHGGRIIVESKISKGTTFTVSLPGKNQGT